MIRMAQIKTVPVKGDLRANHARLMALLRDLDAEALDVIITPECFLDGYVVTEEYVTAENIAAYGLDAVSSDLIAEVADWSALTGTWVVLGCTTVDADGARNTALILDRDGQIVGQYHKVHCQTHDMKFVAGDRLPVFDSDFGRFGVVICADRRWPETVRTLALQGARIIFNPTYGMCGEKNLCMMRTRSYESEVFIAFTHPAQSLVTGPGGDIVCDNRSVQDAVTVVQVDLAEVDDVRRGASAHLRDRRPDVYAGLLDETDADRRR
jgi:predicted amidohydrolase